MGLLVNARMLLPLTGDLRLRQSLSWEPLPPTFCCAKFPAENQCQVLSIQVDVRIIYLRIHSSQTVFHSAQTRLKAAA
jgi:hypothetical protein